MVSVKSLFALVPVAAVALLTGCTSMEQKLGRGIANISEPIRMGEFTRSTEQTYLTDGPVVAQTYGVVHGVARTVQRTVIGAFEVATFPIPSENLINPEEPVYPDSYTPRMSGGLGVGTDKYIGIEDGGVLTFVAGSDFAPLEN